MDLPANLSPLSFLTISYTGKAIFSKDLKGNGDKQDSKPLQTPSACLFLYCHRLQGINFALLLKMSPPPSQSKNIYLALMCLRACTEMKEERKQSVLKSTGG